MPYNVGAIGYAIKRSDSELHNNSAERTTNELNYTKLKETLIIASGIMRSSFDLKQSDPLGLTYGKVYKNGVAVGTERITTSLVYVTFTEDLVFSAGDLYQIYVKIHAFPGYVRNQKVLGTTVTIYEDSVGY